MFYSPSEYVETNFDDDGELRKELKKRGLPCPKWANKKILTRRNMPQRKKKLIAVIRNEMGLEMSKAFETVTRLELEFFRCKPSSEDITDLFTQLYHIIS